MEPHLPPKADRIFMCRTILAAAAHVLAETDGDEKDSFSKDGPSTPRDKNQGTDADKKDDKSHVSTTKSNDKFRIAEERYNRRISAVLRDSLPKKVALYLHLPPDCDIVEETTEHPADPFGCVVLLLANHIIHCGMTGYDARTRSVIKMASVHVLAGTMEAEGTSSEAHSLSKADSEDTSSFDVVLNRDAKEGNTSNTGEVEGLIKKSEATLSDFMDESWTNIHKEEEGESCRPNGDNNVESNIDAERSQSETQLDEKVQLRKLHFDATRKYEAIEKATAVKLLQLLLTSLDGTDVVADKKTSSSQRNNIMRGIKIGGAAVAAGTLLAVTGGLAAPGIAAGIAALGIGTTAALTTLTSTAMMATLFGIGGGGLTAYKMKRRTDGLMEFRVRREGVAIDANDGKDSGDAVIVQARPPELYTTVCVSGWLRDKYDFQRPWGATPTDPPLESKLELLKRFYSVYNPENVAKSELILSGWRGREEELWKELKREYGRDPDHLLPIEYDALDHITLSKVEDEKLGELLAAIIINNERAKPEKKSRKSQNSETTTESTMNKQVTEISSFLKESSTRRLTEASTDDEEDLLSDHHMPLSLRVKRFDDEMQPTSAWDYLSLYGGDLYSITWQSQDLLQVCDYVNALAKKLMTDASKEVFKQTALAALLTAVAWPAMVMKVADTIDEPWTLISIRSDEAGVELANCLLQSEERKPVTLVGFSFGARIVYSCLKELARHQERWEEQQERKSDSEKHGSEAEYSREPASIVEDAILMGTPKFVYKTEWLEIRRIVAGRLINCYSRKDWILSLMFQIKNVTGVLNATVGTAPVRGVRGVENFDVSDTITAHSQYCVMVQRVLRVVGHGEPTMMVDE